MRRTGTLVVMDCIITVGLVLSCGLGYLWYWYWYASVLCRFSRTGTEADWGTVSYQWNWYRDRS